MGQRRFVLFRPSIEILLYRCSIELIISPLVCTTATATAAAAAIDSYTSGQYSVLYVGFLSLAGFDSQETVLLPDKPFHLYIEERILQELVSALAVVVPQATGTFP